MPNPVVRALLLTACLAAPAQAAPVTLMAGPPDARHVTFAFDPDPGAAEALVIETRQVGNPGASLRIWIDRSPIALFERILTAEDCKFDDDGALCRIVIPGGGSNYAQFVAAFRAGRTLHVEVRNAAVMEMQENLSLKGFSATYDR